MDFFQTILERVLKFRDDRNWSQFHTPKDLAISLNLEAAELLENFQWKDSEEALKSKDQNLEEELADVVIYAMLLADKTNIVLLEAVNNKITLNEKKYPVKKSNNSKEKYTKL